MKTVSAADANRHFSKLLREVQGGETVLVTSRGKTVARIEPADSRVADQEAARKVLLERLRSQPALNIPITWTRDDLYDD